MRYLSIDLESTGLEENAHIIEFAAVPFDTETGKIEEEHTLWCYVQCPTFEDLKDKLNPWVIEHNEGLIRKASEEGKNRIEFQQYIEEYLDSSFAKKYFGDNPIVLFGKSMSAIDLPFLNRDLGWEWMNQKFSHRTLDLTCLVYGMIDLGILPDKCESGSELMKYLGMGEVAHTAKEDAINTAKMYLRLLEMYKHQA